VQNSLSLGSRFFKAHGHGNDYLVFHEGDEWPANAEAVQAVCHPHRGVGGDGIVALLSGEAGRPHPPFRLRMFNPDGSEFERSGNGLRVLGAHLFLRGWVKLRDPFLVEVGGDSLEMEVLGENPGGLLDISVEMGRARFGLEVVSGDPASFQGGTVLEGPKGEALTVQPVSMGNPHCVLFRDDLWEEELVELGPFLTSHVGFSQGTNVQIARVVGEGEVEILIWERGVGRTSSSGTSACAVASACVHTGRMGPGPIKVRMEGGSFTVSVSAEMGVRLEGPVEPVLQGEVAEGMMAGLRTSLLGPDPDQKDNPGAEEQEVREPSRQHWIQASSLPESSRDSEEEHVEDG
jgi:diaminopimelate epimerase